MGGTLHDRIVATGGRSTGFDYLRIVLALAVIIWHSFPLSYGPAYALAAMNGPFGPPVAAILPLFFALSGFLVAGSLERSKTLPTFLGLRVIRIGPALAVEVVLSALLLGPLLTTVPLWAYFTDPKFFAYFLNMVGSIHYRLPGVFASNPYPDAVNGQLWTVPWELRCYIALAGFAFLRLVTRRGAFLAITFAGCVALKISGIHHGFGVTLLVGFLAAVSLYSFRDVVPWNGWLFLICAAAMFGLLMLPGASDFAGFPASYVTVYLGLTNPRKLSLLKGADYSYGLYLYGFVIQQALADAFPWSHQWYLNLALTVPIASLFAALSWTFVEKPALKLKVYLPAIELWLASFPPGRTKIAKTDRLMD